MNESADCVGSQKLRQDAPFLFLANLGHEMVKACRKKARSTAHSTSYLIRAFTFVLVLAIPLVFTLVAFQTVGESICSLLGLSNEILVLRTWLRSLLAEQLVVLSRLYCPGDIIVYGDYDVLSSGDSYVFCSNHQIYTDWLTIWCMTMHWKAARNLVIILKESLLSMPLFGRLIKLMGFIGISRDWNKDEHTIKNALSDLAGYSDHPLWLLMFPEGTVITRETYTLSKEYAKRNSIPGDFEHVLLPKSRGISTCIDTLMPKIKGLIDLTIIYSGLPPNDYPYDHYSIQSMFFGAQYPKRIHIYVKYHSISSIPGKGKLRGHDSVQESEKVFADWLRGIFLDKDCTIKEFHEKGYFEKSKNGIVISQPCPPIVKIIILWIVISLFHLILLKVFLWCFRLLFFYSEKK